MKKPKADAREGALVRISFPEIGLTAEGICFRMKLIPRPNSDQGLADVPLVELLMRVNRSGVRKKRKAVRRKTVKRKRTSA